MVTHEQRKSKESFESERLQAQNFQSVRILLASPEAILGWSNGEVTKPETLNYRTLKPERDGLFCERIFGPVKDWECSCGKYKKVRNKFGKPIVCDKCGVTVTRSRVRRERMGHINLAAPVAHIWYSRGAPSYLCLILDVNQNELDKVVYFAQYLVTSVDETKRDKLLVELESLRKEREAELGKELEAFIKDNKEKETFLSKVEALKEEGVSVPDFDQKTSFEDKLRTLYDVVINPRVLNEEFDISIEQLKGLRTTKLLTEEICREMQIKFPDVFEAGMGAEAVLKVLQAVDLAKLSKELEKQLPETSGKKRQKIIKRLRLIGSIISSGNQPAWMVLSVLPVLPPELHPMVQMGGGRFASSGLNDLYRRVISRNNRLKHLLKIGAPEIIVRNEKRMLQEAVDALIDNGRRAVPIQGSNTHPLKSLTDLLRGKQGRFRQNLLGKRVDYSGRAVIISGPELKLHQCGLPKYMALELFKPFLFNRLISKGYAQNIRSAKRITELGEPIVWDLLEEVVQNHPVLLNRAPTLHRLGIQAFYPILVEGAAIRLHPLVCTAFNADFDGDQMAVHVPLMPEAIQEARKLMLSNQNLLAPRSGTPIMLPTLDMVLGIYFLTSEKGEQGLEVDSENKKTYADFDDLEFAYESGQVDLRETVLVRDKNKKMIETTAGRVIFNRVLPPGEPFHNKTFGRDDLEEIVSTCHNSYPHEETVKMLDAIKEIGFKYATKSGTTIAISDIKVPAKKRSLLKEADKRIDDLEEMYNSGFMTREECDRSSIQVWMQKSEELAKVVQNELPNYGGLYLMSHSGAKGNIAQIRQMAGMRGLMNDPKGRIIKMPIRASLAEGLTVFEFFISTHGARKGLADTALRTADSGYLTRRLADISQEVIVLEDDCGVRQGVKLYARNTDELRIGIAERITSRFSIDDIVDPKTKEVIVKADELIDTITARKIERVGIKSLIVRSPIRCIAARGICAKCYGASLATNEIACIGEAVGIIAAQSIGEPGTQMTMRTFHSGGVAGIDITSGLPRVVEIFEARNPKGEAVISEIAGKVKILESPRGRTVTVKSVTPKKTRVEIPQNYKVLAKTGSEVIVGDTILTPKKISKKALEAEGKEKLDLEPIVSKTGGKVKVTKGYIEITQTDVDESVYSIPPKAHIVVENGQSVLPGQNITFGPKNPHDILRIQGKEEVQSYLTDEIQKVYRSQGVHIHDKHIEIVVRQMLSKVKVTKSGSTGILPGEIIDQVEYERTNIKVAEAGLPTAHAQPILLGVTRASLATYSFLAAASFQETARVLADAAIRGKEDHLIGLKENVIIGHLIPARLELSDKGRDMLAWDEIEKTRKSRGSASDALDLAEMQEMMAQLKKEEEATKEDATSVEGVEGEAEKPGTYYELEATKEKTLKASPKEVSPKELSPKKVSNNDVTENGTGESSAQSVKGDN